MIIDCDTHLMPRDAFDGVGERWASANQSFVLTKAACTLT